MYYLAQPPAELPCNPYLDPIRFSLRIECVVAVNENIGQRSDFQIHWFAQLGDDSTTQTLMLNDTSGFFLRIDRPTVTSGGFYIFHSQARIADMERSILDRFWCQFEASEDFKNSSNITTFQRSRQTIITDINSYTSPSIPFCPQLFFFHQPIVECVTEGNDSQLQPPSDKDTSSIPTPLSTPAVPPNCPPNSFSEENVQTNRLVSVLLPSLLLPILVAILLVIAAVIMSCRRSRKPDKKRQQRQGNLMCKGCAHGYTCIMLSHANMCHICTWVHSACSGFLKEEFVCVCGFDCA